MFMHKATKSGESKNDRDLWLAEVPDEQDQIVFTSPGRAELRRTPVPKGSPILIRTERSIVSAGTELACLRGTECWAPLPFSPGYGSVGRIVQTPNGSDFAIGDRVLTFGAHAEFTPPVSIMIPVPNGLSPERAVFARMASVAITALRVADVSLGDPVAVVGLGVVGNMAAQLFALAGCDVIGIDPSPVRRELARSCGISRLLDPADDLVGSVSAWTRGRMCRSVVEASGSPAAAERAPRLAGRNGEMILLGSPRGRHETDLTAFLNHSHLWDPFGCVTIKGAHEWRLPVAEHEVGHWRHSMEGNLRIILDLLSSGRLKVDPLLSHDVPPACCQQVYDGLATDKEHFASVVFNWTPADC